MLCMRKQYVEELQEKTAERDELQAILSADIPRATWRLLCRSDCCLA